MDYLPRVVDQQLDRWMEGLPAIVIEGAKAVGKTATARRRVAQAVSLDDDDEVALHRADHDRLTRLDRPLLIDEWQHFPPVWDRVRHAVDDGALAGSFLLAGSALPTQGPKHSGAGRIAALRMRPMSLAERNLVTPTVSLAALLGGQAPTIEGLSPIDVEDYTDEIVSSGLPGIRALPANLRPEALAGYIAAVLDRDFPDVGRSVRRPGVLRAWLTAYGAASSTCAAYNVLLDAATPGQSIKPAKSTILTYREVLERMWLVEDLPAWAGGNNHFASLRQSPKHHLADPALAARLLGVSAESLLRRPNPGGVSIQRDGTLLGALFESLVTLSVRVYADAARARVTHLRTQRGDHEVDLIVTGQDGAVVALEVKLAPSVDDADVRHLLWLRHRLGDDLADAAVITTGQWAHRRADGIAVIPAALLGP